MRGGIALDIPGSLGLVPLCGQIPFPWVKFVRLPNILLLELELDHSSDPLTGFNGKHATGKESGSVEVLRRALKGSTAMPTTLQHKLKRSHFPPVVRGILTILDCVWISAPGNLD